MSTPTDLFAPMRLLAFARDRALSGGREVDDLRALFREPGPYRPDHLAIVLSRTWASMTRHVPPLTIAARSDWLGWWRYVDFVWNGFRVPSARPTTPLRLYRAAADGYVDGLSWTTTPDRARRYIGYWGRNGAGQRLYTAEIRPEWMHAHFQELVMWTGGPEFICDVPLSAIEPYEEV
ncbi:hypothetical protein [Microbacterium sp.]|uniref:hypothetical protein n=1 Tax=Microbacterium sp. TaxID=51671 RepID=UPI003C74745F